ncbi:MAG: Ig-like domain-containing protein [Candidatus Levybacteria bacterium]|nr:Ig-like domain-containing protein [Candidatus Levybacteria bacterium]
MRNNKFKHASFVFSIVIFVLIISVFLRNTSFAKQQFSCKTLDPENIGESLDTNQIAKSIDVLNSDLTKNINEYNSFFPLNKDKNISKINELSSNRKSLLIKLMRNNPNLALSKLLKENEINNISGLSENCAENKTTINGTVEALHVDLKNEQSIDYFYIATAKGERIQLRAANGFLKTPIPKHKTTVNGYKLDNEILFNGMDPLAMTYTLTPTPIGPPPTGSIPDATGPQKTVVILANFKSFPQPTLSTQSAGDLVFNQVNNYYLENSYGKTSITGSVYGWYNMDITSTCSLQPVLDNAVKKADPYVNFSQFQRIIIFAPFPSCWWAGMGTIDKWTIPTNEGNLPMSVAWIGTMYANSLVVGHEFGHNLGNHHAGALQCNNAVIAPSGCNVSSYGDSYDIMGNKSRGHMNAPHKDHLGFFSPSNIKTVTSSGNYALEPLETASIGLKAIKIPRGGDDYLFVEYRQPIGYDSNFKSPGNIFQGALLHTLDPIEALFSKTYLLDITPGIIGDEALLPGNSFTDPVTGAVITVVSRTNALLNVNVTLSSVSGPTPTPTSTPTSVPTPTPTMTPIPTPTSTPIPTSIPTQTPSPTPFPTPTSTPIPSPTPTPIPTISPTPTPLLTDKTAPVVSITSPVNNSVIKMGAAMQINASATDNIKVAKVEFYVGATLICVATTSSGNIFSCNWIIPNTYVGYYILTARAIDSAGNIGTSPVIYVFPRWY